jgi:hypothetical protein
VWVERREHGAAFPNAAAPSACTSASIIRYHSLTRSMSAPSAARLALVVSCCCWRALLLRGLTAASPAPCG